MRKKIVNATILVLHQLSCPVDVIAKLIICGKSFKFCITDIGMVISKDPMRMVGFGEEEC